MSISIPPISLRPSAPVHQHRTWRHLQRAAVAAYPQLSVVTQANFCSLMVPAASVAVWILQHAPRLAARAELSILVVNAIEFQALDRGRWFQFIPWLLGRPGMQVRVTLQGSALCQSLASAVGGRSDVAPLTEDALDRHLRTRGWLAVNDLRPAEIFPGTLMELPANIATGRQPTPDLCVLFSPAFSLHLDTLLADDALLPLVRRQIPLAIFSSSEAEQLVDDYALEAHGLKPRDRECWPNPWALPNETVERSVVYGKMGWAAEFDVVPSSVMPDPMALHDLSAALDYLGLGLALDGSDEPDAIMCLGESLGTAPRESAHEGDEGSALLRLPQGVAVDTLNGAVYQLQDMTALLLDMVPHVPAAVLETFPGDDDVLQRVMWAVRVHREHVSPFVGDVDDALRSQFAKLSDTSEP